MVRQSYWCPSTELDSKSLLSLTQFPFTYTTSIVSGRYFYYLRFDSSHASAMVNPVVIISIFCASRSKRTRIRSPNLSLCYLKLLTFSHQAHSKLDEKKEARSSIIPMEEESIIPIDVSATQAIEWICTKVDPYSGGQMRLSHGASFLKNFDFGFVTYAYSVSEATQELIVIESLDLPKGFTKNLAAPLNEAIKLLTDNNPNNDKAACAKLDDFLNIAKEKNGKLTAEQADDLRLSA